MRCALVTTGPEPPRPPWFPEVPGAVEVGRTDRGHVYADATMGVRGRRVAEVIVETIEEEIDAVAEHFGNIALPDLPVVIVIAQMPGVERAYHHAPDAVTLFVDARTAPTVQPRYSRFLVAALLVDLFAVTFGRSWSPADSLGEALSRVLAASRYPRQIAGFSTAAVWLDSDRADYINMPAAAADDPIAVGAAVLFLNWLHYQLGYSWEDIIACGAPTLAEAYHRLTAGSGEAFEAFRSEIDLIYPPGKPADLGTDNPYPRARQVPAKLPHQPLAAADTEAMAELDTEAEPEPDEIWSGEKLYEQSEEDSVESADSEATGIEVISAESLDITAGPDSAFTVEETISEWLEEVEPEQHEPNPESPEYASDQALSSEPIKEPALRRALARVSYPASRKRLIESAMSAGASEQVLELFRRLPTRRYSNDIAVLAALEEIR
jgi:hypothetical protein